MFSIYNITEELMNTYGITGNHYFCLCCAA